MRSTNLLSSPYRSTRRPSRRPLALLTVLLLLLSGPAHAASCGDWTPADLKPSGEAITDAKVAGRFLEMATFGPSNRDINYLAGMTIEQWLNEQFDAPMSCHYDYVLASGASSDYEFRNARMRAFWTAALTGRDQLRQRVALALSEIWVVSEVGSNIPQSGLAWYYDILVKGAFDPFRDTLEKMAKSPEMGSYLSMLGNQKADEAKGIRADENFARELMQLFTIGLIQLKSNGEPVLDANGNTVPSYTQTDVENLARILTGWNFSGATTDSFPYPTSNWTAYMSAVESYHDTGSKTFLGTQFPAGQTAKQDLKQALDLLVKHPNTAPFISKRLIQRLVTSNPSPDYVKRVGRIFLDNGAGQVGDMRAVVKAILTDKEATQGTAVNANFGRLREPLLILSHLWRALGAYSPSGQYNYAYADLFLGQAPLTSPSVFNWFQSGYAPAGEILDAGLVSPEFQTVNDATLTRNLNEYYGRIYLYSNAKADGTDNSQILIDAQSLLSYAQTDPSQLVSKLNRVLRHGQMSSQERTALIDYLKAVPLETNQYPGARRVHDAIYLIIASPDYLIFR